MKTSTRLALVLALVLPSAMAMSCGATLPTVATAASDFSAGACALIDAAPNTPQWLTVICDALDAQGNKTSVVAQ
ncbi:MAG: hypothetical protein ACHREM_21330, partial [Polyangiales bacterium]